ncbi:MAG: Na(+)/H(+) antiporter subunit D [Gemmatimonadales bacterium]|nr:MAG: Na(+)/H(+) antiporter subunit D [Gemmatimonadales bacterium]
MFGSIPPGLFFVALALVLPFLPRQSRAWAFLVAPVLSLVHLSGLETGTTATWQLATFELEPLRVDRLANVFGWILSIITLLGGIFALHLKDTSQQVAALLYAGSALGVVYAGDLFTLFFFWEIMAFGSAWLIWARRTPEAYAAGLRYIYVHLFGGAVLLGGILWQMAETGSLRFEAFDLDGPGILILVGFFLNAAAVPLHAWIADAYPRATITGAVFMSALTSKTAVYTLARGFPGWEVVMWVGVIMAVYGVTYAILSNDMRRVLAYHIVSQVGFMVAGIGIGTEYTLNGASAHAFTNILEKSLLFMATGAIIHATGVSRMSHLGGLYKKLPVLFWLYMIPALSISSAPFLGGFLSKPMTISGAEYATVPSVVLLMHLASVGTLLSVGLKLPYFTWFTKPRGLAEGEERTVAPIPWNMYAAIGLGGAGLIFLGLWRWPLYNLLPYEVVFDPYETKNLKKAFQLIGFATLAFLVIAARLKPKPKIQLDFEWFYRAPSALVWKWVVHPVVGVFVWAERVSWELARALVPVGFDPVSVIRSGRPGPTSPSGETASTGFRVTMTAMVMIAALAFAIILFWFVLLR